MQFRYPWTAPISSDAEKVGLFSIGSLEEKILFALYPLLRSSDLALGVYKKFDYPQGFSFELIREIKTSLEKENTKYVIFDIRIRDWSNTRYFTRVRLLSQALKDNCDELEIESAIILSNGEQPIGNALGVCYEMLEASDVLGGTGPSDLTKFTLEIASEILLMSERTRNRLDAKKWLKDKIISGELLETAKETLMQSASFFDTSEKLRLPSLRDGYVHHIEMDGLHSLKSELALIHPGTGFLLLKKAGDWIDKGDDIFEVCVPRGENIPLDAGAFRKTLVLSDDPPKYQPFILERLGSNLRY